MDVAIAKPEVLAEICQAYDWDAGEQGLLEAINRSMPDLNFKRAVTRGSWYRLGGVVDKDYHPIAGNIAHWVDDVSGGDIEKLVATYMDAGYFATRLSGKTIYFTAACGDAPESFIQLEIELLQEVIDRVLIEHDWYPDSLEEFIDPLDYPRLPSEPVAKAYLQFRRITPVEKLLTESPRENQAMFNLQRFFRDWSASSAGDHGRFCEHWILALREYLDSDGEYRLSAKPYSTFQEDLSAAVPNETPHGAELANAIHNYDRVVGYPFAWYFNMLSSKSRNFTLAEAVLKDQMGAYDYLPVRDLKVLRQWEERPYGV